METIGKIISAGLITGAVFTLFLYSPMVSPELYKTDSLSNIMLRPGVSFKRKIIKSSRPGKSNLIETYRLQTSNLYAENRNPLNEIKEDSFDPLWQNSVNTKDLYTTSRSPDKKTSTAFALSTAKKQASSEHSAGRVSAGQSYGFLALRADQSIAGATSLSVASAENNEISSPGDNPTGNVLPVSDGLGFLFLLAAGFTAWIRIKSRV